MDPVTADGNTGSNFNRYWYANNNPYKFTDPDGRQAIFRSGEAYMEAVLSQPNNQQAMKEAAVDTAKVTGKVVLTVGLTRGTGAVARPAMARLSAAARAAPRAAADAGSRAVAAVNAKTTEIGVKVMGAVESAAQSTLTTLGVNPASSANIASQIATPAVVGEFPAGVVAGAANVPGPGSNANQIGSVAGQALNNAGSELAERRKELPNANAR